MEQLITMAARALAAGDPLGALNRVALCEDAPALALRGLAMAQLGDFARARALLRRAATRYGGRDAAARARCVVAEAEIALVSRDLAWPAKALDAARATLDAHGDRMNAAHARHLEVRRLLLLGRLDEADRAIAGIDPTALSPATRVAHELARAGIAIRRVHAGAARDALVRARRAARNAGIPALMAEVDGAARALQIPAARLVAAGAERLLRLEEVEAILGSRSFIVDACRHVVVEGNTTVLLATRPVLFTLARLLAQAWPADVSRDSLIETAFRTRHGDESHRVRLRVEIGRLRRALQGLAGIDATPRGFQLTPRGGRDVVVLAHPSEEPHAAVMALLSDGESWSSSALALALGASQRTVQRALETLASRGKAQAAGRGRARRWMAPAPPGYTTTLLLPLPPIVD
ncbi:helix-turn-helix domain-containing protein [Bordetella genomosp. 11]|uniref:Helix-turn-helix domain-containing protein n=1 Tax=Bordetella genomosp. 11 TaxID=1416808 RepID=A0A261UYG8_9BORD|nr:helix-turn-helix domain-containing protein [Bordetella genomosp. 11]OZI66924.1 helix-turn-helix domain-containing protein [Bordetella genomosp. 11]